MSKVASLVLCFTNTTSYKKRPCEPSHYNEPNASAEVRKAGVNDVRSYT